MFLDLPPEILIQIISYLSIQELHRFQLVSSFANEIIQNHSTLLYRNLAVFYGLSPDVSTPYDAFQQRRLYYDWLRGPPSQDGTPGRPLVDHWKEYVKRQFLLEQNWARGKAVPHIRSFDVNGPHRIQIDEAEGTVASTYSTGSIDVQDLKNERQQLDTNAVPGPLRTWVNIFASRWSHIEFDNGFLIWSRGLSQIEIWRRISDQIANPLPACKPDQTQQEHHEVIRTLIPEDPTGADRAKNRGKFWPFAVLQPPRPTSASRYVHPHLVLATRDCSFAYLYDVPNTTLLKTISLSGSTGRTVRYVEHSPTHIFVCTADDVRLFRKSDGHLAFTLTRSTPIFQLLSVPSDMDLTDQAAPLLVVSDITDWEAACEDFQAVHVSPCGRVWVVLQDSPGILVVTGCGESETVQVTAIDLFTSDLQYLAFDGYHIAIAAHNCIYTISLDRMRDPSLSIHSIHRVLASGNTRITAHSIENWSFEAVTCLQLTDTAVWFVAREFEMGAAATVVNLNFAESSLSNESPGSHES